jgi:hypothetical protein
MSRSAHFCDSCRLQSIHVGNRGCSDTKEGLSYSSSSSSSLLCLTYRAALTTSASPRLSTSGPSSGPFGCLRSSYPKPYTAAELRPSLDLTACRLVASQKPKLCANHLTVTHPVLSRETILSLTIPSSLYWRGLAKARGPIVGSEQSHVYTRWSLASEF